MDDDHREFWKFCKYVIDKLSKHGPIGVIAFGVMVLFAFVCILTSDIKIISALAVFFLIVLGMVVRYYMRESDNRLSTAKINLQKAETIGEAKKEKYRISLLVKKTKPKMPSTEQKPKKKLSLPPRDNSGS